MTPDEITLTIPRDRALYSVAHLVLGGLGIRLNLTIEHLEDLQLALDAVLERVREEEHVTIAVSVSEDEIETAIGPMRDGVRAELEADATDGQDVGLRRILDTLVDSVELTSREGGDWVKLTKAVEAERRVTSIDDRTLLRRYHEDGDLAAREQLIEQYMSLVRSLARRYSYRGEQLDDLVQIGAIGLIKAIDRFDVDRGVELTTYATPNIIGEIKRHFRDKGWSVRVPRGLQELNVQLSKLIEELTVQLGRSPTIAELAKAAGTEEELVVEALESGRAYSSVSLSTGGGQDDEGELDPLESLGAEEPQYEVSEDRAVLAPGFRVLDERERKILHLRFFKGLTQSQIAQQVGISQMHVSRLIRRALEKIREEIATDEEEPSPAAKKRAAGG